MVNGEFFNDCAKWSEILWQKECTIEHYILKQSGYESGEKTLQLITDMKQLHTSVK